MKTDVFPKVKRQGHILYQGEQIIICHQWTIHQTAEVRTKYFIFGPFISTIEQD